MNAKKIIPMAMIITVSFFVTVSTSIKVWAKDNITALEVMEKMDNRDDGQTMGSDITMVLVNKKSQKRIRKIKTISKDYGKDTKKIIFFLSPADVKNTAYMSFDWNDTAKEDDSWLYLPALKKVKRIASSDKSSAFMGSDFSYSDINGITIENWDYTFVKQSVMVEGSDTWVIQGVPKDSKKKKVIDETGYLKSLMWIRKDNFMVVKAKYWVKKGHKIKFLKASDIKKIDGIWTACKMTMITTAKGKVEHTTLLKISNVIYNKDIEDTRFTTLSMERGL